MYGVVVTPPLNETEIMHVVYVEEKIPLLFIKRIPISNRAKLTKKEYKDFEKKSRSLMFEERNVVEDCIEKYVKIFPLNSCCSSGDHLRKFTRGWENECYCELLACEYIDVSEEQNLVIEAPWNHEDPRFVTYIFVSSCRYVVCRVSEVLVSERNVYSSQYDSCIQFNAYHSIPLQSYVIRSYHALVKQLFIAKPFEFESLLFFFFEFLLGIYAKWEPNLPMGHLWNENKDFGLIYDADGLLLPKLLGKNPYASVCLYVADIGPSRLSRFAIKDLSDIATKKVNMVINTSHNCRMMGDDCLLTPRYLYLKILSATVHKKDGLVPGTWIKFTASSPAIIPDFRIKTWNLTTNPLLVQFHVVPTCSGYVFEAYGFFEEELRAVKSTVFGFIEIPREKLSLMNPRDKRYGKKSLKPLMNEAEQCYVIGKYLVFFGTTNIMRSNTIFSLFYRVKELIAKQRCSNNRAIVNNLIQASADKLFIGTMKLLTAEKLES
uniref:Uncharacterized protein n=1 Tax=Wuchereria bancrofti TaxID=6293 RepID=A0AAF5PLG8_WUCBA